MPSKSYLLVRAALLSAVLVVVVLGRAQEAVKEQKFFDVSISPDEIYQYTNLEFTGDFTSFESPAGRLALGKTEGGVTILIILGSGAAVIEAPEAVREKFSQVFGAYPLKTSFKSLYMRLHPKEFEEKFGALAMTKAADEDAFKAAKAIFEDRFLTSYHAGQKAIYPPYLTRVMDFDTAGFGLITNEEGYWITLRRVMPYASVYPSRFVNPKQK